MKKRFAFSILICLLAISETFSQDVYAWRLGFNAGASNYYGDLNYQFINAQDKLGKINSPAFPTRFSANLAYRLSPSWGLNLQAGMGRITANDRARDWNGNLLTENPNFDRALNFQTKLQDVSLSLVYHLNNDWILRREARIAPFLYAGGGITHFDVFGDLSNAEGERYYYWPDQTIRNQLYEPDLDPEPGIIFQDGVFEKELRPLRTELDEPYPNVVIQIPFGLGVDIRISRHMSLGLQAEANYVFSDYLDDVSGTYKRALDPYSVQAYAINPGMVRNREYRGNPNGRNDWYGSLTATLAFHFGKEKSSFKSPQFYSAAAPIFLPEDKRVEQEEIPVIRKAVENEISKIIPSKVNEQKVDSIIADSINETIEIPPVAVQENRAETLQEEALNDSLLEKISALQAQLQALNQKVSTLENKKDTVIIIKNNSPKKTESIRAKTKEDSVERETIIPMKKEVKKDTIGSKEMKPVVVVEEELMSDSIIQDKIISEKVTPTPIKMDSLSSNSTDTLTAPKTMLVDEAIIPKVDTTEQETQQIDSTISQTTTDILAKANLETNEATELDTSLTRSQPKIDPIQEEKPTAIIIHDPSPPLLQTRIDTVMVNEIQGLSKAQVFFSVGSDKIRPHEEEVLLATSFIMGKNTDTKVIIRGFADRTGNPQKNLILSQKRAEAVAEFLRKQGIAEERISIEHFGDTVQRYGEGALDRRVELELVLE